MEEMMSNRKNTVAEKQVAKPVAKPVANTVHNHSDLEQQISELKKELKQAMTVIDRLSSASIEMSAKIEVLSSKKTDVVKDERVDVLLQKIVANSQYLGLRTFYKFNK